MKTIEVSTALVEFTNNTFGLQLRDDKSSIENPGKVVLFGGLVEAYEDNYSAMKREIQEELSIDASEYNHEFIGSFICPGPSHIMNQHVWIITGVDFAIVRVKEGFLCTTNVDGGRAEWERLPWPEHLKDISVQILDRYAKTQIFSIS
jgi:8-oxo-dGTP pyrophosphatase MutT (NUDIX family)